MFTRHKKKRPALFVLGRNWTDWKVVGVNEYAITMDNDALNLWWAYIGRTVKVGFSGQEMTMYVYMIHQLRGDAMVMLERV